MSKTPWDTTWDHVSQSLLSDVMYVQKQELAQLFSIFKLRFPIFLDVSGRFRGPRSVKTAPGGLLRRVRTKIHQNRTTRDRHVSKNRTKF